MSYPTDHPRRKFHSQKWHAKRRGIEWLLTFDQWWDIWQASGKWDQRGRGKGQYVMSRHGDSGPYSKCNVDIKLGKENIREAWDGGRISSPPSSLGKGKGWYFNQTYKHRPYVVQARGKVVGCFATQEQAEAAYKAATATVTN